MPRHYRRSGRTRMAPVIQSYKKVLNFAPTSIGAGGTNYSLTSGVDSVAAGQTSVTDPNIPTGAVLKFIEIQLAFSQIVGGSVFVHMALQQLHTGQSVVAANVVGGNPARNQVFYQSLDSIGINQNWNRKIRLKIPKKFQRVREGDTWILQVQSSNTLTQALQVIYKFYR